MVMNDNYTKNKNNHKIQSPSPRLSYLLLVVLFISFFQIYLVILGDDNEANADLKHIHNTLPDMKTNWRNVTQPLINKNNSQTVTKLHHPHVSEFDAEVNANLTHEIKTNWRNFTQPLINKNNSQTLTQLHQPDLLDFMIGGVAKCGTSTMVCFICSCFACFKSVLI